MREYPSSIASRMMSEIFSSASAATSSVRWVITSPAVRSSNSKMLSIMSFSLCSMTPFSLPTSTIMRISSSVTLLGSSCGLIPHRRKMPLVEALNSATKGFSTL